MLPFEPVIDHVVLRQAPLDEVRDGAAAGVDVLAGTNAHEFALFTAIGVATEAVVSGEFTWWVRRRRMNNRLRRLRDHFIVCAYGRVGRTVVEEMCGHGSKVVVIESKPELESLLDAHNVLYIRGDASDEQVLRAAGIEQARGLVQGDRRGE